MNNQKNIQITNNDPSPEFNLWVAAINQYVKDVIDHKSRIDINPKRSADDGGEAFRDFMHEESVMLENLCRHISVDHLHIKRGLKEKLGC